MDKNNRYSEDNNIQEPAAKLFEMLGWRSIYAFNNETLGLNSLLGRNSFSEVVLIRELDAALNRLNPELSVTEKGQTQLQQARDLLLNEDPTKTLLQHNETKWNFLRNGITIKSPTGCAEEDVHIKVIDFDSIQNNDFLIVRELWVQQGAYKRRCDIVGFINGLPLVFIELKRHDKGLKAAFDDNYTDYKDTIPHLFYYNSLVIVANGIDARFGSITSSWDHFYRWKRLNEEDVDPAPKHDELPLTPLLPILLKGMCNPASFLDIVENFTLFDHNEEPTIKIVARNHQYLGVNNAIAHLQSNDKNVQAGKLGVYWHTQGSGKSYSMVFFCQKIHRKISAAYTFVLLTDRKELDAQIYNTFVGCGISTNKTDKATGSEGLEHLLRDENRRYVFSLIHKFRNRVTQPWNDRADIIVLSDEAHRTQYGRLALNMRMALKTAKFIGFTGTPLIDEREKGITEQVFGRYVSVYDFQRAVADGATLPLFYENRGEKLHIINDELDAQIQARIDAAKADGELDEEQEAKLYRDLAKEYPIFTSEPHLNDVAYDLVEHYHQRWRLMEKPVEQGDLPHYGGNGKAMLVCIDKLTCVKMAKKINDKWQEKISELQTRLDKEIAFFAKADKPETEFIKRLKTHIAWMKETQIHPVFSSEQNEIKEFAAEDIDIKPYREVIAKGIAGKPIDECFKDSKHPFRIAIVCAMWLTGFDVKSLATLYLDKPMKGHTLMQAIARVNRIASHKKNGLIIDYNGMLKSLRKALATYGQNNNGTQQVDPLFDTEQGIVEYVTTIEKVKRHLIHVGFDLDDLINAPKGEKNWEILLQAQNALSRSLEDKKTFQILADDMFDSYQGLFPNPALFEYEPEQNAISAIYNLLKKPKAKVDISAIMQEIRGVVDASLITVSSNKVKEPVKQYDLSGIDFERLRVEFSRSLYKEAATLTLQERIHARIQYMLKQNPTRIELYERYLKIIDEYNKDKDDIQIQKVFDDFLELCDSLDQEQQRYIREGFTSDAELTVFDLLAKDQSDLTKANIHQIKKVAQTLMTTIVLRLHEMDVLKDRASAQAKIKMLIIDQLLEGMPETYSESDINIHADTIYRYIEQLASSNTH